MKLNAKQLTELIELTFNGDAADSIGCDGCAELMDQFAQAEVDGVEITSALGLVRTHLNQCKCCRDEYDALLTALRAINTRD